MVTTQEQSHHISLSATGFRSGDQVDRKAGQCKSDQNDSHEDRADAIPGLAILFHESLFGRLVEFFDVGGHDWSAVGWNGYFNQLENHNIRHPRGWANGSHHIAGQFTGTT